MKPSKTVDLSVMWTGAGKMPQEIGFSQCVASGFRQQDGFFSGFYGFHARGKGLQYCALDADSRGLKFLPVTVSVRLEKGISARMVTPSTLNDVDMFNVARASRELIDHMAEFWYSRLLEKGMSAANLESINWRLAEKFMPVDESLVGELLAQPEFSHLRLFIYPAMPIARSNLITTPISVGVTKSEFICQVSSPMKRDLLVDMNA